MRIKKTFRRVLMTVVAASAVMLQGGVAEASALYTVKADVDAGGGVILANMAGGYYMGRLMPGWGFDRQGGWVHKDFNNSDYAWAMAYGHSDACLWVGPSAGKRDFTHDKWATPGRPGRPNKCNAAQREWLGAGRGINIGSHFNCPPGNAAKHGTEKKLLKDAPFYWNLSWRGGTMGYNGGPLHDRVNPTAAPIWTQDGKIRKGTSVWYRYTTLDKKAIVAFVPGVGWGFFPIGVLNRSRTGKWSAPGHPEESCKK